MRDGDTDGVTEALDTPKLARLLGVDPEHLEQFASHHPNPRPEHILEWAGADDEHAPQVGAWLREHKSQRRQRYERFVGRGS